MAPRIASHLAALLALAAPSLAVAVAPSIEPLGDPVVGPEITHVRARISSSEGIFDPRVSWRFAGESAFHSEPLLGSKEAGVYEADVPARPTGREIEYRFTAFSPKTLDEADWPARDRTARLAAIVAAAPGHRNEAQPESETENAHPTSAEAMVLGLQVKARRPGEKEWSVLSGGEELFEGTEVAFGVETNRTAYVYLAEVHKSGAVDVLFPNEQIAAKNPVKAGASVRIPAKSSFRVDDKDLGTETVMVLASRKPLHDLDKAFKNAAEDKPDDGGGKVDGVLLSEVTQNDGCRTRGLHLDGADDCRPRTRGLILPVADPDAAPKADKSSLRVTSRSGESLVFVPFEFKHVARPGAEQP
jgi:hypothetical protein